MPMRKLILMLSLVMACLLNGAEAPPSPAQKPSSIIGRTARPLRTLALATLLTECDATELAQYIEDVKSFLDLEEILQTILVKNMPHLSFDDKINIIGLIHAQIPQESPFKATVSFIWEKLDRLRRKKGNELTVLFSKPKKLANMLMQDAVKENRGEFERKNIIKYLLRIGASRSEALVNALNNANIELSNIKLLLSNRAILPDNKSYLLLTAADNDRLDLISELLKYFPQLINKIIEQPIMQFDHELLPRWTILSYLQEKLANTDPRNTEMIKKLEKLINFIIDKGGKTLQELEPHQEEDEELQPPQEPEGE